MLPHTKQLLIYSELFGMGVHILNFKLWWCMMHLTARPCPYLVPGQQWVLCSVATLLCLLCTLCGVWRPNQQSGPGYSDYSVIQWRQPPPHKWRVDTSYFVFAQNGSGEEIFELIRANWIWNVTHLSQRQPQLFLHSDVLRLHQPRLKSRLRSSTPTPPLLLACSLVLFNIDIGVHQ